MVIDNNVSHEGDDGLDKTINEIFTAPTYFLLYNGLDLIQISVFDTPD